MAGVDQWVEMARVARSEGRLEDAAQLYEWIAGRCEAGDAPRKAGHARRHAAELLLQAGKVVEARVAIERTVAAYRGDTDVPRLEVANALRVLALVMEADGDAGAAKAGWVEARGIYLAEGVGAGVTEAERRLAEIGRASSAEAATVIISD